MSYSSRSKDCLTAKVQKKAENHCLLTRKCYLCAVKERIVWVDWGKALAAMGIVFIHLPQSQEWFYYRYLQAMVIVIFFFFSGYLKRHRGSFQANWHKYLTALVIPYLIYNILIYPYWWVKYSLQHGVTPDLTTALRPVVGTLLLQHEANFCEPLDGPLWYLPAILLMHVTIDVCRQTRHQHLILTLLCIASIALYAANKYWYFAPNLTPMGLMANFPYYYLGYLSGRYHLFGNANVKRCLTGCVLCLAASILLFAWHLHCYYAGQHLLHIALYYPARLAFLMGVLCGCKLLNRCRLPFIENLSNGTLVIVGLHIVLITAINFILEKGLKLSSTICYQWYEALLVTLLITALLYPVILFAKNHCQPLIGRPYSKQQKY